MNGNEITGRCYCGTVSFRSDAEPVAVTYCHCDDCRRWTGAPVGAFAAFDPELIRFTPEQGKGTSHCAGVERWNCKACGSPLMATFDYLPRQVYVPLGLIDQANSLAPELHCHADNCYEWLDIRDDLDRQDGSGRATLNKAGKA